MKKNDSLKNQVIKGSFWIFGSNLFSRGISFISTLFLAKLLTPEDFGVIGYGFLIVGAIGLIREMGFNSALIYQKNKIEKAASTTIWFVLLWTLFLYVIVVLLAPLAGKFFRELRITAMLRILTFSLVLTSVSGIPMSLMEKEMNFKKRMLPEVTNLTIYGIVTVIFAFLGFKYWSFVIGTLISDICQLILAYSLRPVKIELKIDFSILRELFGFGKNVMSLGILNFGVRNIDDFFVGRMLGTVPLGIYQFSYRISNLPATSITNVLGKILFPSFRKISESLWELRNAFLKFFRYISFITIPITFFIVLIIPDFINLFYPKWVNAILPIQLIAYFGGLRALGSGIGSVFLAIGKPNKLIPITLTQLIFLAFSLYPSVYFGGLMGVCIVVNISITISFIWSFIKLKSLIHLSLKQVFNTIKFPLIISISSFFLIYLIDYFISIKMADVKYLIFSIKFLGFPILCLIGSHFFSNTLSEMLKDFFWQR